MNSILFRCCKQLCGKRLTSHLPRTATCLNTRFIRQWPAMCQSKDDDMKTKEKSMERMLKELPLSFTRDYNTKTIVEDNDNDNNVESNINDFDENRDSQLGDFSKYDISQPAIRQLKRAGINHLFEVQYKTFTPIKEGKDVFVQARTGTGKTLAFALPILESLRENEDETYQRRGRPPSVLTLAPTRELALQISEEFKKFGSNKINGACFYGGTPYTRQEQALYQGIDILVGTPGRILDHLHKNNLDLSVLKHVILDEADRMLDMGFQKDIDEILSYAYTKENKPQTLLFSATLPSWVKQITRKYTSDNMQQFDLIGKAVKSAVLVEHKAIKCKPWQHAEAINHFVQKHCGGTGKALVFTKTKRNATELAMNKVFGRNASYITGDVTQSQRERTLADFKRGRINCLIATDVASRGLDIPEIDLVIQTEPPENVDDYIHRAGRTGRAGKNGLSIVLYDPRDGRALDLVERAAGIKFKAIDDDPELDECIQSTASSRMLMTSGDHGGRGSSQFDGRGGRGRSQFDRRGGRGGSRFNDRGSRGGSRFNDRGGRGSSRFNGRGGSRFDNRGGHGGSQFDGDGDW